MKKHIFCLLLTILLIPSLLPVHALAAVSPTPKESVLSAESGSTAVLHYDPYTGQYISRGIEELDSIPQAVIQPDGSGLPGIDYYGYDYLKSLEESASEFRGVLTGVYDLMLSAARQYDGTGTPDAAYGGLIGPRYVLAEHSLPQLSVELMERIYHIMANDHPELFWLRHYCELWVSDDGTTVEETSALSVSAFALSFSAYDEGFSKAAADFQNAANSILNTTQCGSLYAREFYLHNALVAHIAYTPEATDRSAYTALVTGQSRVGYAAAFQHLLQQAGISSYRVTGWHDGAYHAWNIVKLEDGWHYVDPACDNLIVEDGPPAVSHTYFNVGSDVIDGVHTIDDARNAAIDTLSSYDETAVHLHYHICYKDSPTAHLLSCRCGDTQTEDHVFGAPEVVQKATCTTDGSNSQTCEKCWYVKTVAVPAAGHSNGKETAGADDRITAACTVCGTVSSRSAFSYITTRPKKEIAITGYEGIHDDIVIPGTLDGRAVVRINKGAFQGRSGMTSVTIPDSVTLIEEGAFSGCDALTAVHYGGNRDQWQAVEIGASNEALTAAAIQYTPTGLLLDVATADAKVQLTAGGTVYALSKSGQRYTPSEALTPGVYTLLVEKDGYVPYQREYKYDGSGGWLAVRLLLPGNINGKGLKADAEDMQRLYEHLTGITTITEPYLRKVADVNGDGAIDVYDLQRLYEHVSKIKEF